MITHLDKFYKKKLYMGTFDSLLTKYGAVLGGYSILGLPVFMGSERYTVQYKNDPSIITKDYIKNSAILVNLAKAIGRFLYSYKDIQNLAGYTYLVNELKTVIEDMHREKFVRPQVKNDVLSRYVGGNVRNLI